MAEACQRGKGKRLLHVIIDWSTQEVWQYIRERGLRYCCLYDPPYNRKRIGCVLCPMNADSQGDIELWPSIARVYERAIKSIWKPESNFRDPEHLWRWWLDRRAHAVTADPVIFEDDPEMVGQ
jgi:3'-phosphoadenosine 5'-phosphosulfate sulfotransferase (PAPS reductase)/FAD synthetase